MKVNVSRITALFSVLGAVAIAAGCSAGSMEDTELESDIGVVESALTKGTPGAVVGQSNYCDDPLNPCSAGEGDCDSNAGCQPGLVCGRGKRVQFGGPGDACVPSHCVNKRLDGNETQIDCGGSCGSVCAAPVCQPVGSANRCNADCLCSAGQGDCDSNDDCVSPLVCAAGKLKQFGFPSGNACVPAHCKNRLQDADETQVDCGGACGSICEKIVFVSSAMYTGDLGGLAGADAKCQSLATAARLQGVYKAFLSSSTTSASSRLTRGTGPYRLVNGTVVAASAAAFFSSSHLAPIDRTETGALTGGEVWTGSSGDGLGEGGCNDWTSTVPADAVVGLTVADDRWAEVYLQFCDRNNVRLYCVQQ